MSILSPQKIKRALKENWFLLLFLAVIVGAFAFFRTTPSDVGSADDLTAALTDGTPTVIEFYSNY